MKYTSIKETFLNAEYAAASWSRSRICEYISVEVFYSEVQSVIIPPPPLPGWKRGHICGRIFLFVF